MTRIIAIAGPIGSGKSTLARALAACLGDAATLHFDDYEGLTHQSPEDLARWLRDGGDFSALHIPQLAADLARLKRGETIITPLGEPVRLRKYVLFEMPLGREHGETAPWIDLLIWIDLPAEIALARKLRELTARALREERSPGASREFVGWLHGYLESYLAVVREVLEVQKRRVRPRADLIADGLAGADAIARALAPVILRTLP